MAVKNQSNNQQTILRAEWNDIGQAFTGLKVEVTDTASDSSSKVIDWEVGGVSVGSMRKDGQLDLPTPLPILSGGTGGNSDVNARTNLGLGSIATQDANNLSITGGSITGITDLAIADGGTGASTVDQARANIAGILGGFKNKLINGNFDLWQRGTSFTSAVAYGADRWVHSIGDGVGTTSRQSFTLGQTDVPGEPEFFWRHNRTTASTVENVPIRQHVEGVRTFAGQTCTLSFWAKISSGTKVFSADWRQLFGSGGSPAVDGPKQGYTATTSWQRFSFIFNIDSIAGKTIGSGGDDFLQIRLAIEQSDFSTFTLDIARVQLERGSVATDFEERHIDQELSLAQRYYEKTYNLVDGPGSNTTTGAFSVRAGGTSASSALMNWRFNTRKRATPTMVIYSTDGTFGSVRNETAGTNIAGVADRTGEHGTRLRNNAATSDLDIISAQATADSEL